jgi:hypothetical protein
MILSPRPGLVHVQLGYIHGFTVGYFLAHLRCWKKHAQTGGEVSVASLIHFKQITG